MTPIYLVAAVLIATGFMIFGKKTPSENPEVQPSADNGAGSFPLTDFGRRTSEMPSEARSAKGVMAGKIAEIFRKK